MAGQEYNSYSLYGSVHFMKGVPLLYSFVFVLASTFGVLSVAVAENRLSGFVFASDGCQLQPPSEAEACIAALVPIGGTVAVRKRGGGQRKVVSLSDTGTFTTKLAPGRYNVRLLQGRSGGMTLVRKDYRISPAVVSVSKSPRPTHNSVYFSVSHRSRPETPFAGVSDGCEGK
jgi:hypothetical protein